MHEITNNDIANFLGTEPISEEYEIINIEIRIGNFSEIFVFYLIIFKINVL